MFYISSKKGDKYGVTDSRDGVEEFYTKLELKALNIPILGMYPHNKFIVVIPPNDVKDYIVRRDIKYAINNLPLGYKFIFNFNGCPTKGDTNFISDYTVEIKRLNEEDYGFLDEFGDYSYLRARGVVNKLVWYVSHSTLVKFSYR